jgi:hypothetical protein
VVASLRDLGDGTSKLIFDDVSADSANNPVAWDEAQAAWYCQVNHRRMWLGLILRHTALMSASALGSELPRR